MLILAVDPGSSESAIVAFTGREVRWAMKEPNEKLLFGNSALLYRYAEPAVLVIESIESYGMPVGREVFDTVFWSGRLYQEWYRSTGKEAELLPRRAVKLHLCGSARAKDANIRAALLDKFGGKAAAIGTKKNQGPLFGIHGDMWSALALAVTYVETRREAQEKGAA